MDETTLRNTLADLPLGGLRFFNTIGSTNEEAAGWIVAGAPDLSLVIADEQTAGRGRLQRRWFTPPGAALAFSLVLRQVEGGRSLLAGQTTTPSAAPDGADIPGYVNRLTALGALAVSDALRDRGLTAEVKWPNDILLQGRKTAGILVELYWLGDHLDGAVMGIGVNVAPQAIPPEADLVFPATSVETVLGRPVERWRLLREILVYLLDWKPRLSQPEFIQAWEDRLAFRDQWVWIHHTGDRPDYEQVQVLGINADGSLRLRRQDGEVFRVVSGEIRMKPV